MVRTLASSGARVGLALAAAGTGKTTAMAALARAWEEDGGHVLGLASSANAAHLLGKDMAGQGVHIDVDTVDKLVWLTRHPQRRPDELWFERIDGDMLIIVDEAGKSGTLALGAVIAHAQACGASVRLVGDNKQLSSISAGGVLTDIAHEVGAATLTEVMRFSSRAEAAATLALRDGDPAALGFYADEHRIHVAADTTAADMAFARWVQDGAQGWDSMLLAPTNETVTELNARAREHRLDGQLVTAAATLSDGLQASVGDIVSTRENARKLRLRNGRDFVRNGYRWRVTKVNDNGGLTVARLGGGHSVTLPREYVASHTTLGYAATIDAAQGDTIGSRARPGTCHVVGNDKLNRQQIYTALSRGVSENHIYLSTAETDPHRVIAPKATHPDTAIDVLTRALARDDAQVSATTATREAGDPLRRLAGAAQRYVDAVGAAAEATVDPAVMREVDTQADTVDPGLTAAAAWPVLRQHLAIIALGGDNPVERLREAAAERELGTAGDTAAVLDWRLDYTCSHSSGIGPLRWLPNIPVALREEPLWAEFLTVRRDLVAELADDIRGQVLEWSASSAPAWARSLLSNRKLAAEITVFRAAMGVEDSDTCITGPPQYPTRARRIQVMLQGAAEQIVGGTDWQFKRWRAFVDELDPRIGRDAYWIPLAAHLSTVARTGVDVRQLLADAAGRAPLPDEMPAAALWWRLHGILTPAVVESASQRLRPAWLHDLNAVFGTTLAETIAADPAFPGLVAAVEDADPARWTPLDLLLVAAEHLRDVETPIRPDEFARLLTYSIDLFTTEHPFDSAPPPTEAPLTAEEEEQLSLVEPPLTVEEEEQMLVDAEFTAALETDFVEDLSVERPAPLPLPAALADVNTLRRAYQEAAEEVSALRVRIVQGMGPAVLAAAPQLLDLRARAEADRPYMLAVSAVAAAWDDAEVRYQESLGLVESMRGQLRALEADADADPLEVASARAGIRLAMMALPDTAPAQRFQAQLFDAVAARAAAAGGADRIVTAADVDAARLAAEAEDQEVLRAAVARRDEIGVDRDRAEAAAARAFAEARTRNADHIVERRDQIVTELAVLTLAGGRTRAGGIPLSAGAVADLDQMAARAVASLARYDRTVTVVHAADDEQMLTAMSVLHAAAAAADRKVMWCAPTAELAERARGADVADTVAAVDDACQRFQDGVWQLPSDSVLVLDHAADVEPNVITDLARHAEENRARVILLDAGEQRWPPPPSSAVLRLLHQDLPWSATLSARAAVALRVPQPDLDALLEQAAGFDQSLLPDDVVEALAQRELMRGDRLRSHRAEQDELSMRREQSRDDGLER
jgi:hypothetical protein